MPTDSQADIQAKLEASRKDLLDLTFRNPLLNYRALAARGVEVVGAQPESVYAALVAHGRKLSFAAKQIPKVDPASVAEPPANDIPAIASETSRYYTISEDSSTVTGRTFEAFFDRHDRETAGESSGELNQNPEPVADISTLAADSPAISIDSASPSQEGTMAPPVRRDTVLQTDYAPAELLKRLMNTQHTARSFIEEQGVNTLFLALGMLRWREPGAHSFWVSPKEGVHRSPLVLIPVELERASASERFSIRYAEEEITGNVSLATYLKRFFDLELPSLPEREDLEITAYLEKVQLLIAGREGWDVEESAIALAFFSFNKYLMYRELDDDEWPLGQSPSEHPVLAALLGSEGFHERESQIGEADFLDDLLAVGDSKTVVEADSSQLLAIEDVKRGQNLVIQGPPGTGKSQSITNIIAEALGQGKTVLFVSEKMAALEVVKRRLDSVGLGDACLELHSNKTNKKAVLSEKTDSWSRQADSESRCRR